MVWRGVWCGWFEGSGGAAWCVCRRVCRSTFGRVLGVVRVARACLGRRGFGVVLLVASRV